MLHCLRLRGAAAFDRETGADIGPLAPVTFIFGPNGSGKTTISRALADPARFQGTALDWEPTNDALGIKVYNRDYVDSTLTPSGHLPGVFVLGEASAEVQSEIESLMGPGGLIAGAKERLLRTRSSLSTKTGEINHVRTVLKEAAWGKRDEVPVELREMFTGYNNSKERFLEHLLEVAEATEAVSETIESLVSDAAAVLAEDAQPLEEIPLGREVRLRELPGSSLFEVAVVGSADVRLAPLIEKLGNVDWVRHGRPHLERADGLCPFCQQSVPADLAVQLEAYFDERYVEQVEQLAVFAKRFESWADEWTNYLDALVSDQSTTGHLALDRLASARTELESAFANARVQIDAKQSGPSRILALPDVSAQVDAVNAIVREANVAIREFNLLLADRLTARQSFLERCWAVFARGTLAIELAHYEGAMPGHLRGKERLEEQVALLETEIAAKEVRLRELQQRVTSSRPIIDRINRLLSSVGFHSFWLAESNATQDGYLLVRSNGDVATETLSEGERTFIAFLYFAQSLQASPQDETEPQDLLAVIDDPISSLDSDVLYSVSTLVRRIVEDVAGGAGRVRQLVLLTHNVHFYKEVTYRPHGGPKTGSWKYGVVRKRRGSSSEVEVLDENPIQTAYGALWDEVRRSSELPDESVVGLQNTLRRILETYFKVLGGIDDASVLSEFEGDDQILCRALFSWVNSGSHSIFDDLDYAVTPSTVEANLRVFRRIFETRGQLGHYEMMMR